VGPIRAHRAAIVSFKIRGAIVEDVHSEVLLGLIVRLRELKSAGDHQTIRDFRSYTAVAAYHGCDKYYRRSNPQRYHLENRLRYLLGTHSRLALWVAPDGEWVCGNIDLRHGDWQPKVRPAKGDVTWASSREAARLV
jgi:hypothetical protein